QQWQANSDESLYGLGENQLGLTDIKGYDLDLWQHNGTIVIPFLVSSRHYGILWDNPSYSRFGKLPPWEAIPAQYLQTPDGQTGGFQATYFSDDQFEQSAGTHIDATIDVEQRKQVNGVAPATRPAGPLDTLPR